MAIRDSFVLALRRDHHGILDQDNYTLGPALVFILRGNEIRARGTKRHDNLPLMSPLEASSFSPMCFLASYSFS